MSVPSLPAAVLVPVTGVRLIRESLAGVLAGIGARVETPRVGSAT
jgi:hypothetical protein